MEWRRRAIRCPDPTGVPGQWVEVFSVEAADGHVEATLYDPTPEAPHLRALSVVHIPALAGGPNPSDTRPTRCPRMEELADLLNHHFPAGTQLAVPVLCSLGREAGPATFAGLLCVVIRATALDTFPPSITKLSRRHTPETAGGKPA